jgi:anti-sigma factor RsiW
MNCSKSAKKISEYVDGGLEAGEARRLEEHLEACPDCRRLVEDFRGISAAARRIETPSVPDGSWGKIRSRLRSPAAPDVRVPLFGRFRPAYGIAAAAMAIGLGALFFVLSRGSLIPGGQAERERYALAKLDEAEKYYEKAIKAMGEAIADEKGRLAPQVAEMFARNMEVVDASIRACRAAVRNQPDDLKSRDFLLAAYSKKLVLLDDLLSMDRNGFPGQEPGKAI